MAVIVLIIETYRHKMRIWGRCYDHYYRRFSSIFGECIDVVFIESQCCYPFFLPESYSLNEVDNFFSNFFNILKIITSFQVHFSRNQNKAHISLMLKMHTYVPTVILLTQGKALVK
jgi:hypothetical protein